MGCSRVLKTNHCNGLIEPSIYTWLMVGAVLQQGGLQGDSTGVDLTSSVTKLVFGYYSTAVIKADDTLAVFGGGGGFTPPGDSFVKTGVADVVRA